MGLLSCTTHMVCVLTLCNAKMLKLFWKPFWKGLFPLKKVSSERCVWHNATAPPLFQKAFTALSSRNWRMAFSRLIGVELRKKEILYVTVMAINFRKHVFFLCYRYRQHTSLCSEFIFLDLFRQFFLPTCCSGQQHLTTKALHTHLRINSWTRTLSFVSQQ